METEHLVYMLMGFILTCTNLLVFTTIMIHKALRNHKEYVLLGLLVFFNALLGLGFLSAGMFRACLKEDSLLNTRLQCLTLPHMHLFAGTPCVVSLLLPFIAIDRLVAVTRPLFYYSLRRQYTYYIVTFMVILHLSCYLFAITQTLANPGHVSVICDTRQVFGHVYKRFEAACVVVGHLSAVLIYIVVISCFCSKSYTWDSRGSQVVQKRRTRIVQTFGLFSLVTLVIVVIPYLAVFVLDCLLQKTSTHRKYLDNIYLFCTKMAILNPTLNVVMYALRHNEIYMGMKTMLKRQQMPASTEQWKVGESYPVVRRALSLQSTPRHKYSLAHYQMLRQIDDDLNRREKKDNSNETPVISSNL